ncbi:MAG: OB-fold nucleic acid binding domain-containing protein [Ilumatobacteraceae bacterium]
MSNDPLTLRDLDQLGLERIKGVGPKTLTALEAFDVRSVLDLLETYPRRYVDRTNMATIADLVAGVPSLVMVRVVSVNSMRTRNGKVMVTVNTTDDTNKLTVTFFNQGWREKQLTPGLEIAVFGKPEMYRNAMQMTNPLVDPVGDRTGRIVPIYPQSEKSRISSSDLAKWIEDALNKCAPRGFADTVPQDIIEQHGFLGRGEAMRAIHLPDTVDAHAEARRRLAFDEVLRVQLMLVGRKA